MERSPILVAEPVKEADLYNAHFEGCAGKRSAAYCHSKGNTRRIVQILNDKEMLVMMRVSTASGMVRGRTGCVVRGVDTTKLTEDSPPAAFRLQPCGDVEKYSITGTYRYKSTNSTMRTVFVADAQKAEEDRIAEQKRLMEAERVKSEARRRADAEREAAKKAAEKAEEERKANAENARWRVWSYGDGTSHFEAKIIGVINGNVALKKRAERL